MSAPDPVVEAEQWFRQHGLAYFVPSVRSSVRDGLRPRRFVPPLVAVVVIALAVGGVLAWLAEEVSAAPAVLVSAVAVGAVGYALTALRAGSIVSWAAGRSFGSLRLLVPMVSRALPLLLVFVTFLFINAEAWQMTANLTTGLLWLTVLLLSALAVLFLLVRLPEEVDRTDDDVDHAFLRRTTHGTPLQEPTRRLLDTGAEPGSRATVTGLDRGNLILVLLVVQISQVLLLVVAVFVFFLLFGSLVMTPAVQDSWTQMEGVRDAVPGLPNLSWRLVKVSLFLAAFSGLYFTVSAVTDDTYRSQFFDSVTEELERAVGMRAVYLTLRHDAGRGSGTVPDPGPVAG